MPLDPVKVQETRLWFAQVKDDLRGAQIDLEADPPLIGDALFHSQQAVEKAEKGFLVWHDQPFRKVHDLVELGNACSSIDPSLDPLLRKAAGLTMYSTAFRYPGMRINPTLQQARDALCLAEEVQAEILRRLPAEISA